MSAHPSDGSDDATVTSVMLPLPLWVEQQLRVQNYAITVINVSCVTALALSRTGHLAPSKAERYHWQVKWHQARLTLPWAGKMAPGKAERYHRQIHWH